MVSVLKDKYKFKNGGSVTLNESSGVHDHCLSSYLSWVLREKGRLLVSYSCAQKERHRERT